VSERLEDDVTRRTLLAGLGLALGTIAVILAQA
jgi:hypothetical protein